MTGAVVALVWAGVGDGPLNVVLEHEPGVALPADTRFVVSTPEQMPGTSSSAWHVQLDLSAATLWDARPAWARLQARPAQIAAGAKIVADILAARGITLASCGLPTAECATLDASLSSNTQYPISHAIRALIGRGPGLTPAGDDWLAGWLLAAWLAPDGRAAERGSLVVDIAAGRTTTLSQAFLACAAAGEADEHWHHLLTALADAPTTALPIYQATNIILSHGATSGAAMLLGLLASQSAFAAQ